MKNWLPERVAALRATIHAKLLTVYVVICALLLSAAGVGLYALREMNLQAQEIAQLQRKIAAYRQLNHDTIAQLYGVATTLVQPEERRFQATLRQLKQFGYDLDRLQFLSQDELITMGRIRAEFEQFIAVVTQAVQLIRAGRVEEGRRLQLSVATPLADQLERDTNHLVNRAEADMIASIDLANDVYAGSRQIVIVCGVVSVLLALGLGYLVSRSLIDPIHRMETMMRQLATGDFSRRVQVANRDELGQLAQDMNRTSEELGRLYAQLDALRENAERANRDKSHFLAAASHDLRQPMHAMTLWVGNMQAALSREDRGEVLHAAAAIEAACRSMNASFNAILDLSRFDARATTFNPTQVDVTALCAHIVQEHEPEAHIKGITLRFRRGARTLHGHTDEVLLGRVLRNLLGNAIKFCNKGGVLVGLTEVAGRVRVRVADTGVGIARVHWEDIFNEFYQVPGGSRDRQQGVGLGLAIVKRGLALLDGHLLSFHSTQGKGTCFTVSLPRARTVISTDNLVLAPALLRRLEGAYVAVVDDEPLILGGLTAWLRNHGCLVVTGDSCATLLAAVGQNERIPDALITDWRLQGGETGLEVIHALREECGRSLPAIVITGDPVSHIGLPDRIPSASWVQKPIDSMELLTLLAAQLPERQFI